MTTLIADLSAALRRMRCLTVGFVYMRVHGTETLYGGRANVGVLLSRRSRRDGILVLGCAKRIERCAKNQWYAVCSTQDFRYRHAMCRRKIGEFK